jgi:DNA invertase Pin-like site-specific DNA recombinase
MIGYAHVSPKGQNLQQRAALEAASRARLFEDVNPEGQRDQPELARMLDNLRAGTVVTVTRLGQAARSRPDLLAIAVRIKQANAGLRSLAETWADTTTLDGSSMLTGFAGIVDFERALAVELTSAGQIAKMHGVKFGRWRALSVEQIAQALQIIDQENKPVTNVASLLGVHRSTLYRALDGEP